MVKKTKEVSDKIVFIFLVIAVVVAVTSAWVVYDGVENIKGNEISIIRDNLDSVGYVGVLVEIPEETNNLGEINNE